MKPYYDVYPVTIYHGDCREVLPQIQQAGVMVTDPPYGVGMNAFEDSFEAAVAGLLACDGAELGAIFMSPRRIIELANRILPTWNFERLLWMHKEADIAAPWRGWCMNSEAILIVSGDQPKWPKPVDFRSDVYRVGPWERVGHPNGKPLSVVQDLVRRLTAEGECVIDPFMGSGTTLVAAKSLGIPSIGIEFEERYCEMAVKRLSQETLWGAA